MEILRLPLALGALLMWLITANRFDTAAAKPIEDRSPKLADHSTGFESQQPGPFQSFRSNVGKWTVSDGTVQINGQLGSTGHQSLHLMGGDRSVVELQLNDPVDPLGQLTFRAERWTRRGPFSFRIEKWVAGKWAEIYNGDREILVGRSFKSNVVIRLDDANIKRLRFSVTSPEKTGVMIDDLRIAPALPQRILGVDVVPVTLPALVGADSSAILKLNIRVSGTRDPLSLTGLNATLQGTTDIGDIAWVKILYGGSSGNFPADTMFGEPSNASGLLSFRGQQFLQDGDNFIWVACRMRENADIDHCVGATCTEVAFSNGKSIDFDHPPSIQQIGVAVRDGGDDGVHTYRIPGLATTTKGTLVAVYDVRRGSGRDLPGDIDVGMSRSTDGGRTWQSMQVIMDMGNDPTYHFDGIGDPCVLVDATTGTIWCAATWSHGNRSWHGSAPGLKPDETGQFMLARSDDDGVTWSQPINITEQVKDLQWSFLLQGPGKGITTSDGTLVFPVQYQDPPSDSNKKAHRLPHSAMIYSRDHGHTWNVSTAAFDDTTESQVIELAAGQIMINCRYNRASARVVMTSDDWGQTWNEHPSSRSGLIEPGACMASLINVGRELRTLGFRNQLAGRDNFLLFSNPDSLRRRNHITIKASTDGGLTWPGKHHLLLDEQNGFGYSCLTMIDAETVGILYEGSQAQMTFQRVKIADVLSPPNRQITKDPALTSHQESIVEDAHKDQAAIQ